MTGLKPAVYSCLSELDVERFLTRPLTQEAWPFGFERLDPSNGVDALVAALHERRAEVLMTGWSSPRLPDDLRQRAPALRYVCNLTGGVRQVVSRHLIEKGLILTNWGPSIARTVAEHSLTLILASQRRLGVWQHVMHVENGWGESGVHVRSLFGRSVGIHGLGAVARELVRLLAPFGCDVSAYSAGVPDDVFAAAGVRRAPSLEALFGENDVVVELEALTDASRGSVGAALLDRIRPGGVFVNCGRGAVVDEVALAAVAKRGQVRIACDVFAREPLPTDSPLRDHPDVLLTPHIAGPTPDRMVDAGWYALRNVARFHRGEPLEAVIGPVEYDRMT